MDEKQVKLAIRSDASNRIKGFLYQFMVALDRCFDLGPNESLYVEKYGDLAIRDDGEDDTTTHPVSMEIKMYDEDDNLGVFHHNFLNTLFNWSEESFHFERYRKLALFTTQSVSKRDELYGWNGKNTDERYTLIFETYNKYIENKSKYLEDKNELTNAKHKSIISNISQMTAILWSVKDEKEEVNEQASRDRLKKILGRVEIFEKQDDYMTFYNQQLLSKRAYWDPDRNKIFINALLGFIISPLTISSDWQISYDEFRKQLNGWAAKMQGQKMIFPSIDVVENPDVNSDALFLKKLKDIEWKEVDLAIHDYAIASKFIEEETSVTVINSSFNKYKDDLMDLYTEVKGEVCEHIGPDINAASRAFVYKVFNDSRSIHMDIYEETVHKFARGVYHNMANEPDNNIVWKLK